MYAYNDQAFNLNHLGRYQEAREALESALKVEPDSFFIRINRAFNEYVQTGDVGLVEEEVRQLPKEGEMLDMWVVLHFVKQEWEELVALGPVRDVDSVAAPAEFIGWNVDQSYAHNLLGDSESARSLVLSTLPVAEKLVAENPTYWARLADIYALLGRREEAFDAMEEWQDYLQQHTNIG